MLVAVPGDFEVFLRCVAVCDTPSHILDNLTAAGSPGVRVWLQRYRPGEKKPSSYVSQGDHLAYAKIIEFPTVSCLVCLHVSSFSPCFGQILSNYKKYRQYREQTEKLAAQLQGVDGNKQA